MAKVPLKKFHSYFQMRFTWIVKWHIWNTERGSSRYYQPHYTTIWRWITSVFPMPDVWTKWLFDIVWQMGVRQVCLRFNIYQWGNNLSIYLPVLVTSESNVKYQPSWLSSYQRWISLTPGPGCQALYIVTFLSWGDMWLFELLILVKCWSTQFKFALRNYVPTCFISLLNLCSQ